MQRRVALPSSGAEKDRWDAYGGATSRSDRPWAPRDALHSTKSSTFHELDEDELALFQRLHRQLADEGIAGSRPGLSSSSTARVAGLPGSTHSARFSEVRHLAQLSEHEVETRWALRHKGDIPDELVHAFNIFADERTGKISVFHLQRLCYQLGERVTLEELKSMFDEVDRDGDGEINLDEFISIMAHGDLGHRSADTGTGGITHASLAAAADGYLETGSMMSSVGANPQEPRQPDPGIIFQAIELGDEARTLAVLAHANFAETNARDGDGCTMLHLAASRGLAAVCHALLARQDFQEVNTRSLFSWTALFWAARYGHLDAAKVILEHPRFLEVNAYDGEGRTALHYAAYYGHVEVCNLLLSHFRFTESGSKDCIGQTALHTAALSGNVDVCRTFVKHPRLKGVNAANREGNTALHCAAAYDYADVCRALLEPPRPVNVEKVNRSGKKAVDLAKGESKRVLQQTAAQRATDRKHEQQKAEAQKALAPGAVGGIMGPPRKFSSPGVGFVERQTERTRAAVALQQHDIVAMKQIEAATSLTEAAEQPESSGGILGNLFGGEKANEQPGAIGSEAAAPQSTKFSPTREEATLVLPAGARLNAEPNADDVKLLFGVIDAGNQDATLAVLTRVTNANGRDGDGCTVLHRAAERGQTVVCRTLLGNIIKFAEANGKDSDSCSALHYAALSGHADTCRVILEHAIFSEADAKDCTGCSALHHSALNGHAEVCQTLLDHPRFREVNSRDYTGCTALHFAADHGHITTARTLVYHERFTKIGAKDKEGNTALHLAAGSGRAEICRLLLEHSEVLGWKDARNRRGFSALDVALGEARQVLNGTAHEQTPLQRSTASASPFGQLRGGDAENRDPSFMPAHRMSPEAPVSEVQAEQLDPKVIFEAIASGSEANAVSIISRADFASSNGRDVDGCTALHRAAERGLVSVCRALLGHPNFTDANAKNGNGMTALHYAALNGYANACWTLLEHPRFSKMNAKDCTGCSALHHAGDNGHAEALKALLDHPRFAEADSRDRIGWTALHYAALGGHAAGCRVILEHPRFSAMSARDFTPMARTALGVARGDAWYVLHEITSQRPGEGDAETKAVSTSRAAASGHDLSEHPKLRGDSVLDGRPAEDPQHTLERKLREAEERAQRLADENARLQRDLLDEQSQRSLQAQSQKQDLHEKETEKEKEKEREKERERERQKEKEKEKEKQKEKEKAEQKEKEKEKEKEKGKEKQKEKEKDADKEERKVREKVEDKPKDKPTEKTKDKEKDDKTDKDKEKEKEKERAKDDLAARKKKEAEEAARKKKEADEAMKESLAYEAWKLNGVWWKEAHGARYSIQGDRAPTLTILESDITSELVILAKGRCRFEVKGQVFNGEVTKDGRLLWSNGAKWFREDLDGVWRKESAETRYVIEYQELRAQKTGKVYELRPLGDGKCEWLMDGSGFQGELSIVGKLRWSNGAAWSREETPLNLKRPGREFRWKPVKVAEPVKVHHKLIDFNELLTRIQNGDEKGALDLIAQAHNGEENAKDGEGRSALHYAAMKGLSRVCHVLLERPTFDCQDATDGLGYTALHLAASNGHAEACKTLLDHLRFSAANVQDNTGCTALHHACSAGHDAVVRLFLEHHRFTAHNTVDRGGSSVLHSAAGAGHLAVVNLLLPSKKFTESNVADATGCTALHTAAHQSHADVCKAILAHPGFQAANAVNKDKRTALHFAGQKGGGAETCRVILDALKFTGSHAKDSVGFTVLHYAALKGHAEVCQVLVEHQRFTATNDKDINNRTALDLARGDARRVLIAELG